MEGYGDVKAVPVLLRRLAAECGFHSLDIPTPVRTPRSKIIRGDKVDWAELERALDLAFRRIPSPAEGAVLILIDADESCPAKIAPQVIEKARRIRRDVHLAVVLAKCEFEAWFISAMESLRGKRRIRQDAVAPPLPETVADAKGYLRSQMDPGARYSEPVDQPALAAVFDMQEAAGKCRSFRKMRHEFGRLIRRFAP